MNFFDDRFFVSRSLISCLAHPFRYLFRSLARWILSKFYAIWWFFWSTRRLKICHKTCCDHHRPVTRGQEHNCWLQVLRHVFYEFCPGKPYAVKCLKAKAAPNNLESSIITSCKHSHQQLTTAHNQCGFQKVHKRHRPQEKGCVMWNRRSHAIPHWQ